MLFGRELQLHLLSVIKSAVGSVDGYEIELRAEEKRIRGFHHWVDGKPLTAQFLLRRTSDREALYLLLMPWRGDGNEYLVIFPESRMGPIVEIRKVTQDSEGRRFQWRYSPSKRDGKNDERREQFACFFGSVNVEIFVPECAEDVERFLVELFELAEVRCEADALRVVQPLEQTEFPEGRVVERRHMLRERNSRVARLAKQRAKDRDGRLCCEVCGFDFEATYGAHGRDFIEAHHIVPLMELTGETTTTVDDLVLLCANCHRMAHRVRPWLSVEGLRSLLMNHARNAES